MADAPKITDLITAGAAVVGIIVATGALLISVITLRLQVIAGLKGQASRITLQVLAKGSSRILVKVRNLSDLPISDLTGQFRVHSGPATIRRKYRPDWEANFGTDQLSMGEETEGSFGVIEGSSGEEVLKSNEARLTKSLEEGRETSEELRESTKLLREILNDEASVQWLDGYITFRDAHREFSGLARGLPENYEYLGRLNSAIDGLL